MSMEEPKLLKPERVINLYKIYTLTGELSEGSPMLELFEHIAALTNRIKQMDAITTLELAVEESKSL